MAEAEEKLYGDISNNKIRHSCFEREINEYRNNKNGIKVILDLLQAESGRLLDIGCGLGSLCSLVKERFTEVCGLDISAQAVAFAQTH